MKQRAIIFCVMLFIAPSNIFCAESPKPHGLPKKEITGETLRLFLSHDDGQRLEFKHAEWTFKGKKTELLDIADQTDDEGNNIVQVITSIGPRNISDFLGQIFALINDEAMVRVLITGRNNKGGTVVDIVTKKDPLNRCLMELLKKYGAQFSDEQIREATNPWGLNPELDQYYS